MNTPLEKSQTKVSRKVFIIVRKREPPIRPIILDKKNCLWGNPAFLPVTGSYTRKKKS